MKNHAWLLCSASVLSICASAFADPATTQPGAAVVYLAVPDQFPDEARPTPLLIRELVRQALLIAARDGLGLQTRDQVMREWEPSADGKMPVDAMGLPALLLDIRRDKAEKFLNTQLFKLDAQKTLVSTDSIAAPNEKQSWASIPTTLSNCEPMSRGKDIDLLKGLGFIGGAVKPPCEDPAPAGVEELLDQTTLMAPFSALQQTHAAIHEGGESPERLGALVRGYANLGQLTYFQWSSIHVALTARSLLYAQRMIHNDPQSPVSYYHRAYAYAMAGLQAAALADLAQAGKLEADLRATGKTAPPVPDWVALLEPFCKYDVERLALITPRNDRRSPLDALMVFLDVENCGSLGRLMTFGDAALQINRSCFRIIDGMTDHAGVASGHQLTELAPQVMLATLPHDIQLLKMVPQSVVQAIANTGRNGDQVATLASVSDSFLSARESAEPSFALAGRIVQETNFVHVVRRTYFMASMWGVDSSEYVQQARPLIADHPLRAYVESMALSPAKRVDALKSMNVPDPQFQMYNLVASTFYLDAQKGRTSGPGNWNRMWATADGTARDVEPMVAAGRLDDGTIRDFAPRILKFDPYSSVAAAALIRLDWPKAAPHIDQWTDQFYNQPLVLSALGSRYITFRKRDKAEAVLTHLVDIAPDRVFCEQLASFYLDQGNEDKWLATLKRVLDQPEYQLDHSFVESEIAWHYMNTGRYATARPWADACVNDSGSSWSMECDSMAAEYQGDFAVAEQMRKDETERYGWIYWYLWCKRTGRGDVRAAQKSADEWIAKQLSDGDHSYYGEIGNVFYLEHKLPEARKYYDAAMRETNDGWVALQLADVCAEMGDAAGRDQALNYAVANCAKSKYGANYKFLVRYAKLLLSAGTDIPARDDVNKLLAEDGIEVNDLANILYLRGRQFQAAGEKTKAKGQYEQVSQLPAITLDSYLLSCDALHAMGEVTEAPNTAIASSAPATQVAAATTRPDSDNGINPKKGGVPGKLVLAIKGQATIYLNGRQIGTASRDAPAIIPTSLRTGDLILCRAKSNFVYRAFAIAFVPDEGDPRQFTPCILDDAPPEKVTAQDVSRASPAPNGRSDDVVERVLSDAGIWETVQTLELPNKDKWQFIAVVVP